MHKKAGYFSDKSLLLIRHHFLLDPFTLQLHTDIVRGGKKPAVVRPLVLHKHR